MTWLQDTVRSARNNKRRKTCRKIFHATQKMSPKFPNSLPVGNVYLQKASFNNIYNHYISKCSIFHALNLQNYEQFNKNYNASYKILPKKDIFLHCDKLQILFVQKFPIRMRSSCCLFHWLIDCLSAQPCSTQKDTLRRKEHSNSDKWFWYSHQIFPATLKEARDFMVKQIRIPFIKAFGYMLKDSPFLFAFQLQGTTECQESTSSKNTKMKINLINTNLLKDYISQIILENLLQKPYKGCLGADKGTI